MKKKERQPAVKFSLLSLTMGGFTIGMAEFLMMGVLPDVSANLHVSIPEAGHLISIYALGVIVGAPLIVGIAGHRPPKEVLMGLMLTVFIFSFLFSVAPNYGSLLITRFLCGLPHGAFFGIGAVVASRLAQPGKEARAVSMMYLGLTIANIIGVPIGTFIGHNFSWRLSFGIVSFSALLTILSIKLWMPALSSSQGKDFKSSLGIFADLNFWLVVAMSAIGTGGFFAWISYIAPLVTNVSGFSGNMVTLIMVIVGLGMAVGNIIGGNLADRFSPLYTAGLLLLTMSIGLVCFSWLSYYKVPVILMTFIIGAIGFSVISPMQMLIINVAKGSEMLASSVLQASGNCANALGAFLGGLPIAAGFGFTSADFVGSALALFGCIICAILAVNMRNRNISQQILPED